MSLRIEDAIGVVEDAAADGLLAGARHILKVSDAQAPIEAGDLARSSKVSEDRGILTVAMSYDTEYAVRQHEQMSLNHDAGRTAKFLEKAVNAEVGTAARMITEHIRARLGG